ncbi:MAG: hypothetical protein J2P28_11990 [Actinobacteria bacterium]|nr:hypothetical protein [Actinomycetota bacterium]
MAEDVFAAGEQSSQADLVRDGSAAGSSGAHLIRLMMTAWAVQGIRVFVRFGIGEVLADGRKSVEQIAASVDADAPTLYRMLRMLSDFEVVQEFEGRRFELGPLGDVLRRDAPGSLAAYVRWHDHPAHDAVWAALHRSVKTGRPAWQEVHGVPMFESMAEPQNRELAETFGQAMKAVAGEIIAPVLAAYDFGRFDLVVDVGGGAGHLLGAILAANPEVRGILLDTPGVLPSAREHLARIGVLDRCLLQPGDFFREVPAGDAYLLSNIIHDWDDDRSVDILRNCRRAMRPGATLLLSEYLLPDPVAKLVDLQMLMTTDNGRQRTRGEFKALLARAGWRLTRVIETEQASASLVEAVADNVAIDAGGG